MGGDAFPTKAQWMYTANLQELYVYASSTSRRNLKALDMYAKRALDHFGKMSGYQKELEVRRAEAKPIAAQHKRRAEAKAKAEAKADGEA